MTARFSRIDLAVLVACIAVFTFVYRALPSAAPYLYDEADYMSAGRRGVVANLLERPSMSIVTFIRTGLNIGVKAGKRASLSEQVRSSRDITFLRHYHGPLYYYWLAIAGKLANNGEYWMRASGLIFHLLGFAAVYLGVLLLAGSRAGAVGAAGLYLFSSSNLGTATQITPHIPYVLFTILTLLLFAAFLRNPAQRGYWYASVLTFALAFCSVEYAILLPITFAFCFWRFRVRPDRAMLLGGLLIFAAVLAILWPMSIVRLSALKSYFYISYLALLRKGSYGTDSPLVVWGKRFLASPVEYSIEIGLVLWTIVKWRALLAKYLVVPCLFYAGLMLLTTLKNTSLNPTYVSSIVPCLAIVSGVAIATILEGRGRSTRAVAVVTLLLAVSLYGFMQLRRQVTNNSSGGHALEALLNHIRTNGLQHERELVPFDMLPTIAYYFPEMDLHSYLPTDDPSAIASSLQDGGYESVIYVGSETDDLPRKIDSNSRLHAQSIARDPSSGRATLFCRRRI